MYNNHRESLLGLLVKISYTLKGSLGAKNETRNLVYFDRMKDRIYQIRAEDG